MTQPGPVIGSFTAGGSVGSLQASADLLHLPVEVKAFLYLTIQRCIFSQSCVIIPPRATCKAPCNRTVSSLMRGAGETSGKEWTYSGNMVIPINEMEALFLSVYGLSIFLLCSSIILRHLRKHFSMRAAGILLASALCGTVISKYICSPSLSTFLLLTA